MTNLEFILLILSIILIILLRKEIKQKNINNFLKRDIQLKNQVLFAKLQKQYLNNSTLEDTEDLLAFMYNYYLKRVSK